MRGTDLSVPKCPAKVSPFGMALGTLAEIAVRLVIGGYIFAVVVYVNASDNWDKDDDIGRRIRERIRHATIAREQSGLIARPLPDSAECTGCSETVLGPFDCGFIAVQFASSVFLSSARTRERERPSRYFPPNFSEISRRF